MAKKKTGKRAIAIIHFNTPELTKAAVMSVWKHCGERYDIVVLDNSDKRPFPKMKGVKVLDNTKQQLIDFDTELEKYPNKCRELAHISNYGSMKHMMSVQYLWEVLPDGFILMESDLLLRDDISFLWDEQYAAVGKPQWLKSKGRPEADRLLPYLCYLNVPLLKANGARYYDPERCWALMPGGPTNPNNLYDTGASVFEDIVRTKPQLVALLHSDLQKHYAHYDGGSWRQNDLESQKEWVEQNKVLWEPIDNSNAKIYICAHTDCEIPVTSKVYEVIKPAKGKDELNGVHGGFYSELLHMEKVSRKKKLPEIIGFCQYRKYFDFMDDVPDLKKIVEEHGAAVVDWAYSQHTVEEQFGTWGNPEDLEIATAIIKERYPKFAMQWERLLCGRTLHPCSMFIMKREDWKKMFEAIWDVVNEYLKRIGGDIDKRVAENKEAYHVEDLGADYARRVGGQICERMVSAWIDWKFPMAKKMQMRVTGRE